MGIDEKSGAFPDGFLWGTATASYQIEGAAVEGGRGPSIWDTFSRTPGKVRNGDTGDVACDHFHRFEEDVKLMADLGIQSYRFSLAWPRIFPAKGVYLESGFDFYKCLLDTLEEHGIEPAITLYHWDLPQWLQDEGGWDNRDTVNHFIEYAQKAFEVLGDRVQNWITHNEPWCASLLSYGYGEHAPGYHDWRMAYRACHHLLLSHGEVVKRFRANHHKGQIGITLNFEGVDPASDRPEDIAAADRRDVFCNRWFLDAVFKGHYSPEFVPWLEARIGRLDFIQPGDMETISVPNDFLGINYYTRSIIKDNPDDPLLGTESLPPVNRVTDMGWEVHPQSLYKVLKRIDDQYTNIPLYITENGAAAADDLVDGRVADEDRIDYIRDHLLDAALPFIQEGGNLKGYYVWSLMDNFEWAFGYSKRFGIIYVDYETQQRIPKMSYHWYRDVIATNRVEG